MSSRQGYLLNNENPAIVESPEFDVRAGVVRLFGSNLGGDIPLLVWVGDDINGIWTPLYRNGTPIILNDTNNSYVEFVSGRYTIDSSAAGLTASIWFEENFETDGDNRTKWVYVTNPQLTGGGGGLTAVATTDSCSVGFSGDGISGNPINANVKLSPNSCNLSTIDCAETEGLSTILNHIDSNCIMITGCGTSGDPLVINPKFPTSGGPFANNIIACLSNPCSDETGFAIQGITGPSNDSAFTIQVNDGTTTTSVVVPYRYTQFAYSLINNDPSTITPSPSGATITLSFPSGVLLTGGTNNGGLGGLIGSIDVYAYDANNLPVAVLVNGSAGTASIIPNAATVAPITYSFIVGYTL